MMMKSLAAMGAITAFTSGLFAQGLTTTATPNDWEEINFEFNSSILSDGYPSLLRLAELLKAHQDYRVKVTGHTDYVGSVRYNDKLAVSRANTVRDFLVKYGASANQLSVAGQGKQNPAVNNRTKEGRFINRRVVLEIRDGAGNIVSAGGVGEAINALEQFMKKQEECCANILKRLDKLDDILAALRDLKGENDKLRSELNDLKGAQSALQNQINALPKPLSAEQTTQIARNEGTRVLEEETRRNKKFSLLNVNVGPTFGRGRTGDYTISGRGQFFSPFGGDGKRAIQAQGEYMYYTGRQEGQFDIGLVNRLDRFQVGAFTSWKYLNFREMQNAGALGQAAFLVDWLFSRGRVGLFGTKALKTTAVLARTNLGPNSFLETYARVMDQVGASALVGAWGNSYFEGNVGYLKSHGGADRPGGMVRFTHPISELFAFTIETGLNETMVNRPASGSTWQSGRVVFGLQFGNYIRPKEYLDVSHPVPMDVPRIRYELLTRRIGNSPPVADAGPDQIGVRSGTITLNGTGSYDPEGDPLTYQWQQIAGPAVSISGANTATATFQAADSQTYSFRLTVKDPGGMTSTARTTVSTTTAAAAQILRFSATPDTVQPGQQSILEWNVTGAREVTITPGIGTQRPSGTATVTPPETTTYTLVATGDNGQQQRATVTVTVRQAIGNARIIRFEAQPTNILPGESSTLSWTTEGGTVSIAGVADNLPANGSRTVSPTQTTTYTLSVTGTDGRTASAPVIVTVASGQVPRILQFVVTPTSVAPGGAVQLCYNVENATNIIINPGVGGVSKTMDCITVNPASTTTYTLSATNGAGGITASATVIVGNVRIVSFSANPNFSPKAGDPVTLTWSTENAAEVTITGQFAPIGSLLPNGSIMVNPTTNTDFTLTAYGANGVTTTAVIHVFVR